MGREKNLHLRKGLCPSMFIDIACNITSECFVGNEDALINECRFAGVLPIFVGLDVQSSMKCLELAKTYDTCCYLGIHPNHSDMSVGNIEDLQFYDEKVIGIGECGLDYYRSEKSDRQLEIFRLQVNLQDKYGLPMFYHCRSAFEDFINIVSSRLENTHIGVVHSFDGTMEEMEIAISKGLYIGVNGCSMKTEDNIMMVQQIPLSRLLLETDSPYCQIRKSHASSRFTAPSRDRFNKPAGIRNVAEAVAGIKGITIKEVENAAYENTLRLFPRLKDTVRRWESIS